MASGDGVRRTTDRAQTWNIVSSGFFGRVCCWAGNTIYASSGRGVYRSTNQGRGSATVPLAAHAGGLTIARLRTAAAGTVVSTLLRR